VRFGAGIFYNPAGSENVYMRRHRQLPFGPIVTADINQFNPNPRRVQDGFDPIPNLDFGVVANNPVGSMLAVVPDFRSGYMTQYNFQVQQQMPWETVFKIGYVGNIGRRMDTTWDYNLADPGPGTPASRRPLRNIAPNVIGVTYMTSDGNSVYNSLQASLEKRFASGLGFQSSYTWSHAIDTLMNAFGGAANGPFPQDIRCRACDRGSSGFDIRHRFTQSLNYALPFGKGRKHSFGSGAANAILGGWDTNGILTLQTGLPFTPQLQTSVSNSGGSRPDRNGSGKLDNPDRALWFNTSFNTSGAVWSVPQQFTYGNGGRNILYGPGTKQLDISLFKSFRLSEGKDRRLEFRTEAFNAFNTPQFNNPNSSIGFSGVAQITSAGNPPVFQRTSRQIQMALKLYF